MGGREKFGYPVLDCDGHITEPLAIWTEYLEPKYREAAQEHFANRGIVRGVLECLEQRARIADRAGHPRTAEALRNEADALADSRR